MELVPCWNCKSTGECFKGCKCWKCYDPKGFEKWKEENPLSYKQWLRDNDIQLQKRGKCEKCGKKSSEQYKLWDSFGLAVCSKCKSNERDIIEIKEQKQRLFLMPPAFREILDAKNLKDEQEANRNIQMFIKKTQFPCNHRKPLQQIAAFTWKCPDCSFAYGEEL